MTFIYYNMKADHGIQKYQMMHCSKMFDSLKKDFKLGHQMPKHLQSKLTNITRDLTDLTHEYYCFVSDCEEELESKRE